MSLTPHHAKYFAHDLTRRATSGMDRLSMALFDAAVDLNPHQIEAALFALQSPLSKGVILGDEVGIGKTIEAGIVLCHFWAERKRRLLVICPASIRKQWALELEEKFNLPTRVLDAKAYREAQRSGRAPLKETAVLTALAFDLERPPRTEIATGRYHLISKSHPRSAQAADEDGGEERSQFLYRLSHPLGEHVVERAKALPTAPAQIVFDVSHHPTRIHAVEALLGKSGFLTLTRLVVESYEREEYLLFSGFDESGASLDQETMEKLLGCSGRLHGDEAERHGKATVSRSLEQNSVHFNQAREKLEKWADDMVLSAEKALADTKEQIKALRRQARQAVTLEEQHEIQQQLQKLEKQQRRQRQDIFKAEDEIMGKRDRLVESLEKRLAQRAGTERLFTIRWAVA